MALTTLGSLVLAGSARAVEPADPASLTADERAGTRSFNDDDAGVQPKEPASEEGSLPARREATEPSEASALPVVLGLGVGYGFRPHDDGRNHGGTAHLYGDIPLAFGFGVRPELVGFAYAPSLDVQRPYASPMVAGSLVYAFDDTDAVAVVGVGGFIGAPIDVGLERDPALSSPVGVPLSGGVLLSLGLRFRVVPGVRVEAGVRVPFTLAELPLPADDAAPAALRAQIALSGGLVLVPSELFASAFASE